MVKKKAKKKTKSAGRKVASRTTKGSAKKKAKKKARSKSASGSRAGKPTKFWTPDQSLPNPRHEHFAQVYLVHHNGGAAWRTARGAVEDEKPTPGDWVHASRLLRQVKVKARVEHLMAERLERVKLDQDTILTMLSDMAHADVTEAYNDDGTLKPLNEIPKPVRLLIEGVDTAEIKIGDEPIVTVTKIKVAKRHKSIELAGKHVAVQAFKDKVEHVGKLTLEQLLAGEQADEPSQ